MANDDSISKTKRWANRPRLKGFDYSGTHAYHLVFTTAQRRPVLIGSVAEDIINSIEAAAVACSFELLVFTVMPDHVHAVVQATNGDASVIKFAQQAKQRPGYTYKRDTGQQLWQPSFYDRVVRRGDDAREIAAYILANPVRAGLMPEGHRWPFSGGTLAQ